LWSDPQVFRVFRGLPDQLGLLASWLDTQPEVPEGRWFKRFSGMTVCGKGDLVKTFLTPGQVAEGTEVK
jgi:hypothetical protein